MDYLYKIVKINDGAWKNEIGYVIQVMNEDTLKVRFFNGFQTAFGVNEVEVIGCANKIVNEVNEFKKYGEYC